MRKGWLYYSIAIGLAALLAFYCVVQLLSRTGDMNDMMGLVILAFCAIMFFCGGVSSVFVRPQKAGILERLKVPLLAACVPILALDLFIVSAYVTNTSQFYSGYYNNMSVRPIEPPFFPVYLLIMAIITIAGLVMSLIGGMLTRWLLRTKGSKKQA
jgi:hypothetical protein